MNSSGITRGVAATAIAALSVAGLPLLASPAHAVLTSVDIVNLRDRSNFDIDEFRDGDDFRIETLDGTDRIDAGTPEYRWVLPGAIEGVWLLAEPRPQTGSFRVAGPSRTQGGDGITDGEIGPGTWRLEARMPGGGLEATPEQVNASESEIVLDAPVSQPGGTQTVSGTLSGANGGLEGRAVALTYTRQGGGDARLQSASSVVTDSGGRFEVTLVDPNGATRQAGTLRAEASGEEAGDATQLSHRYGPNDADNPGADATDTRAVTWEGAALSPIVARLEGRNNQARADVVKAVAPGKARGAAVRLFRVGQGGRLTLLQSRQLNRLGDRQFRVNDRNRRGFTTYVAKVGPTSTTRGDETNRRRVR